MGLGRLSPREHPGSVHQQDPIPTSTFVTAATETTRYISTDSCDRVLIPKTPSASSSTKTETSRSVPALEPVSTLHASPQCDRSASRYSTTASICRPGHTTVLSSRDWIANWRLDTQAQTDQLSGINMRSRASGLDVDAGDSSVGQIETTEQHLKIQNTYEDRNFVSEGQFQQGTEPVLANGIQLAGVWTRDLNPIIVAADESGEQITSTFKAEEYIGAEDRRAPGELEILKTADTASAHPGEEITFTIRFTNRGGRPLSEVRIMDHLTPRIEYVPGSALSELDGRLDLTDEDDGTQVLTFELAEPLEGGQTGEISFRVLVR